jgi:hypothetical protein
LTAVKPQQEGGDVPIDEELPEALQEHREAFIAKFGREPGPDDPLIFDPDASTPQPLDLEVVERDLTTAMVAAGIDPAVIYASTRNGLIVTEENWEQVPQEAVDEWESAIEEYRELTRAGPPGAGRRRRDSLKAPIPAVRRVDVDIYFHTELTTG